MSYNTDLQNNNTSLQEILATVNSLPEAGGSSGSGLEWIDVMSLPMESGAYQLPLSFNEIACVVYLYIDNNASHIYKVSISYQNAKNSGIWQHVNIGKISGIDTITVTDNYFNISLGFDASKIWILKIPYKE